MSEKNGGDAWVNVKLEGMAKPQDVTFNPDDVKGGHDHLDAVNDNVRRAFGEFLDTGSMVKTQLDVRLDANGEFTTVYEADNLVNNRRNGESASSASGFVNIAVATTVPRMESLTHSEELIIRIPNLVPLLDGAPYDLVGASPGTTAADRHPDNHYGTPDVADALQQIAIDYNTRNPAQILRYNDMSLVFGGVFDLNANWINPHLTHACGTDIDVGIKALNNAPINKE